MELTTKPRKHGLEAPFHPVQILSWVITFYNTLIFSILILPEYDKKSVIVFSIIFMILFLTFIGAGYIVSKTDPTDPRVYENNYSSNLEYTLYRDKAKIEVKVEEKVEEEINAGLCRTCTLCTSHVSISSRHCMRCGRCTIGFDHHCKLLNNCIGVKNYSYFIILIFSAEIYHMYLVSHYVYILEILFQDHYNNLHNVSNQTKSIFYATITLGIISFALCASIICYIGYIVGFHVYIKIKGITTFEFIANRYYKIEAEKNQEINSNVIASNQEEEERELIQSKDSNVTGKDLSRDKTMNL